MDGEEISHHLAVPPPVYTALKDDLMGNTIPWAVVMNSDLSSQLAAVRHGEMLDDKAYRDANKKVKSALVAPVDTEAAPAMPTKDIRWPSQNIRSAWIGKFQEVKGDTLILTHLGTAKNIPLNMLSEPSQKYALSLQKLKEAPVAAAVISAGEEVWTNASGKTITATFESMDNDAVKLKLADGKVSRVPLKSLSEASQKRAWELAKSIR